MAATHGEVAGRIVTTTQRLRPADEQNERPNLSDQTSPVISPCVAAIR